MLDEARRHANRCLELLVSGLPADAIAYCAAQRVQAPLYVSDSAIEGAVRLQELGLRMLADHAWWVKGLELRAAREAEMFRIRQGLSALGK